MENEEWCMENQEWCMRNDKWCIGNVECHEDNEEGVWGIRHGV